MNDKKKTLFRLFLSLVIIYSLLHTAYSQENKTEGIIQQENGITHFQNANSSESPEKNNILQGEILIESQRNFDRSRTYAFETLFATSVDIFALCISY